MSAYQRTKGHGFERTVSLWFRELGFKNAKRHLETQSQEAEEGRDLDHTGIFDVQCKVGKNLPNPYTILEQIQDKKGQIKLGIMKRDQKPEVICMYREDFKELLQSMIREGIIKTE